MTKNEIERAVLAEMSERKRTGETWIEFVIRVHDDALEQAAQETTSFRIRTAIRALKVGGLKS